MQSADISLPPAVQSGKQMNLDKATVGCALCVFNLGDFYF